MRFLSAMSPFLRDEKRIFSDFEKCEPIHLTKVSHVRYTFVKLCEAVHIQSMLVYGASLQQGGASIGGGGNYTALFIAAAVFALFGALSIQPVKGVR